MIHGRRLYRWSLLVLLGLALVLGVLLLNPGQSQPDVQAAGCWKAEITEQWTDLDLAGSVLRVSVAGKAGLPVTVRSRGAYEAVGFTGTKPEYGPFVAEFAPMSLGTYYIEPQGLGLSFEIWLDGKNYTRVDFVPLPCAESPTPKPRPATATPRPQPAPTRVPRPTATPVPPPPSQPALPQPAPDWSGRVVQHIEALAGRYFATVVVRVIGRPAGQQVEIRSGGWSESCTTGTKPEHGPDACEFGALNAGTYRITPKDLGTHLDVTVGLQDFVLVEFYYTGPPPQTRWVGHVAENTSGDAPTEHVNSAITVVVGDIPWHEVEIRSNGWSTTCTTGYKPEYGPGACEFSGLRASTYTIIPKDLGSSVQVTVDGWGWAKVLFTEVPAPAPRQPPKTIPEEPVAPPAQSAPSSPPAESPTVEVQPSPEPEVTGWKGWVVSNSSGDGEKTGISSTIIVRVLNWPGVPVHITGGGSWSATCISGTKPEHGPGACEFGGLWPSTYTLQPEGADTQVEVTMDGLGVAFVEFASP